MNDWAINIDAAKPLLFTERQHQLLVIDGFLEQPSSAVKFASLQKFAKITPQYPGVRAALPETTCQQWCDALLPILSDQFALTSKRYILQAWYSLVTLPPAQLLPIQRLPHIDGTDPNQIAMMLYFGTNGHGGTGFYRHISTGLDALTEETFPQYRTALQGDVAQGGLPPASYPGDGSPYFERTYTSEGAFNQAVFYRGNLLHSGAITPDAPLSDNPAKGRLTINGFFRPV